MTHIYRKVNLALEDIITVKIRVTNGGLIGLKQVETYHVRLTEFLHDVYANKNGLRNALKEMVSRFQKNDMNTVAVEMVTQSQPDFHIYHEWEIQLFESLMNYDSTNLLYHIFVVMLNKLKAEPTLQQMYPDPKDDTNTNPKYPWNWKK